MQQLLEQYRSQTAGFSAEQLLVWAWQTFGSEAVFTSSFGAEDQVIAHLLSKLAPDLPLDTIDTGRLPPETYDVIEATRARYGLSVRIWFPDQTAVETMVNRFGPNLFYQSVDNRKLCCTVRKVQVLDRLLHGKRAWIGGLRRGQSQTRAGIEPIDFDFARGIVKIQPLANWTYDQVWAWIKRHQVPYNTLHDAGYASIGCAPCSRAVRPGEDERAGRWWWESDQNRECGLHVDPAAPKRPTIGGIGTLKG